MKAVITGKSNILSGSTVAPLQGITCNFRFITGIERLVITAVGLAFDDAGIYYPVGNNNTGIYTGIDDSIEDIKDEYFKAILSDGMLGASPLLFPFTSPNALTAQASIVFDLRGESFTAAIKKSCRDVIQYATDCVASGNTVIAVAGGILLEDNTFTLEQGRYRAEYYVIENIESALKRGAKRYRADV